VCGQPEVRGHDCAQVPDLSSVPHTTRAREQQSRNAELLSHIALLVLKLLLLRRRAGSYKTSKGRQRISQQRPSLLLMMMHAFRRSCTGEGGGEGSGYSWLKAAQLAICACKHELHLVKLETAPPNIGRRVEGIRRHKWVMYMSHGGLGALWQREQAAGERTRGHIGEGERCKKSRNKKTKQSSSSSSCTPTHIQHAGTRHTYPDMTDRPIVDGSNSSPKNLRRRSNREPNTGAGGSNG